VHKEIVSLEGRPLRYFIAVAECLHFGRAADRLDIAQSALSRQVKVLEALLGVQLLNRGRRSAVRLTEAGEALLRDGNVGIKALARAANASRQAARGQTGRVAVGYVASAAFSGVLPQTLRNFRARHPQVEVALEPMESPAQLAALAEGLIDVAFCRPVEGFPPFIVGHAVQRESLLLVLGADHPLSKRRIEIKQLSNETFIVPQFEENSAFAQQLAGLARAGGFQPRNIIQAQDFLTAVTLAAAGYGIVLAPKSTLVLNIANLTFKSIHGYSVTVELNVLSVPRSASAAVTAFVNAAIRAARL